MNVFKLIFRYFERKELFLWFGSLAVITIFFVIFDRDNYINLFASLIGVTSLIFAAKGNPIGPALMIVFSLIYGYISYNFSYYGEMITYVGMSLPMSILSVISWLTNPFEKGKAEAKIGNLTRKDIISMCILTLLVTILFYFILDYFDTANIFPSTLSVTTSFAAVFLTYKRSEFYAVAYAFNDIILIILWSLAALQDLKYVLIIVCFVVFLINDIYGYINWCKTKEKQAKR